MCREGCSTQELGFPIALIAGETETEALIALSLLVDTNPAVLAGRRHRRSLAPGRRRPLWPPLLPP